MMEMVMGRMPERFARKGQASKPEYFKDGPRLDWPKPKVTKQSRKDVKSTKVLHVRIYLTLRFCLIDVYAGDHPPSGFTQSALPGSSPATTGLRSLSADNCSKSSRSSILLCDYPK
jgi:hypothetical protein